LTIEHKQPHSNHIYNELRSFSIGKYPVFAILNKKFEEDLQGSGGLMGDG